MTKSIPHLRKLQISRCEMLSTIVAEENELGESTMDKVEFPQLEMMDLCDLPNLVSFFPNVNTTSLAKSTDHYHNPLQPQPLFNKKVAFPSLEYLELSGLVKSTKKNQKIIRNRMGTYVDGDSRSSCKMTRNLTITEGEDKDRDGDEDDDKDVDGEEDNNDQEERENRRKELENRWEKERERGRERERERGHGRGLGLGQEGDSDEVETENVDEDEEDEDQEKKRRRRRRQRKRAENGNELFWMRMGIED
ncbi:hypothetical protein Vadar_023792 [Vaccinium darrowii]|uniref:Uncharacterized protein n=1 Tax=Vaccinium darrowii TaxID=229202 RepID=A0ACB7XU47_9ERIC|nr:hypothetical protein Vadar_023792 [Vaccinium darrowii]